MTNTRIDRLIHLVKDKYDNGDPSHDFLHIMRVMDSCRRLGEKVGADVEILIPAALLHDVINIAKDHPDRLQASRMAAQEAQGILKHVGYSAEEIEKIAVVIIEHSYSLGKKPSCIESAVLQDADRLDALGAIGVMRVTTCGGRLGSSYYDPADPFAAERELNDKLYTLDHFYVKLFKLAEKMNTSEGKAEAQQRVKFMEAFVEQLKSELPSA